MILAIKADSMQAYISLLHDDGEIHREDVWEAGRGLARDLLKHLDQLVESDWRGVSGIIVFRGPGSFTSLRIGITTANTIAYSQTIPIVGVEGDGWLQDGQARLTAGENDTQVLPHYGADPHITAPKK